MEPRQDARTSGLGTVKKFSFVAFLSIIGMAYEDQLDAVIFSF